MIPAEILSFLIASIALTISPGPDIIYVLVQSMSTSKRDGIAVSLGLVSGIIIHTSLVAFGVSAIIKASPSLFLFIKIGGALYLLFLAYSVWKSKEEIQLTKANVQKGFIRMYVRGFLMNVLNPKVALFFLAFFPNFIWDKETNLVVQFYTLGFLFMLQALLIFCLVAFLAERIMQFLKRNKQTQLVFKYIQIIVFIGLAVLIFI